MLYRPLLLLSDAIRQRARRREMAPDHAMGRDAEDAAHRYLEQEGLTIIARNWRTRSGFAEVDLIGFDGRTGVLVFVEVKSRASGDHAAPERQISREKRRKIAIASLEFRRHSQYENSPVRFDVVSVLFEPERKVTHFTDAWSPAEALAAAR
jgi:putative endonuclease